MPTGWAVCRLKDVAEYINGRAFKPEEWESQGKPIIRIQNLNDQDAPYNYSCQEYEQKYLVQQGELLFAWAASLGTYIWNGDDAWLNQHIFKVLPYQCIDKIYLHYTFMYLISIFYDHSHGSGMVHITRKKFEDITISLPPLKEQKRIVQAIETAVKQLDTIAENL